MVNIIVILMIETAPPPRVALSKDGRAATSVN